MSERLVSVEDAVSGIKALLGNAPAAEITGLDDLSTSDRAMLLASSCARLIEYIIAELSQYDSKVALAGLDALFESMREHVIEECLAKFEGAKQ